MLNILSSMSFAQTVFMSLALLATALQVMLALYLKFGTGDVHAAMVMREEERTALLYLRVGKLGYLVFGALTTFFFIVFFLKLGWTVALVYGLLGGAILAPRQYLKMLRVSKDADLIQRTLMFNDGDVRIGRALIRLR